MAKKPTPKKPEQVQMDEFAEKYEILSAIYGDPVEVLFEIMTHEDASLDLRKSAAVDLMSFRFPKLKALETKVPDTGAPMVFNINLNAPATKQPELDVTPPRLQLEVVK
jgi:hypothetical protein